MNKIIIEGKEFALPDSLVNEMKAKLLEPKEITFEEICSTIHHCYFVNTSGYVDNNALRNGIFSGTYQSSEKRAKQIAALSKLMTVADYLNEGWEPDWNKEDNKYKILSNYGNGVTVDANCNTTESVVYFKNRELALKAIKILGEEVIKTALGV